jgi:hypothetical protein
MIKKYSIKIEQHFLKIYLVYFFAMLCGFLVHSLASGKQVNIPAGQSSHSVANNCAEETESSHALPAFWLLNAWMF